jgi:hypothetical protein
MVGVVDMDIVMKKTIAKLEKLKNLKMKIMKNLMMI